MLAGQIKTHGLDAGLRRFRNHEMLRICWRELAKTASLAETLGDLSRLAELCLQAALAHHQKALEARFGRPRDSDGEAQQLVVLALGKLGGGELNLSSDIDLILTYPRAGSCDGHRQLANEQFFTRLARALIQSLSALTEDGFCFRVDTRLRPFGEAGPLVCSFGAMEQYYQREGRDWERYALIKARPVAGDCDSGAQLLRNLSPFIYRRYIDFGAVEALRDMLDAIREDAARKDRGEDVKRGPGGIREIEFLVQCVQLLRGGRETALQTPSLDQALGVIERLELLPRERVRELREDYGFLRHLENGIQALHDQQTHSLPEGEDLLRLCRIMQQPDPAALRQQLEHTRQRVSSALNESFPRRAQKPGDNAEAPVLRSHQQASWDLFSQRLERLALSQRAATRLAAFLPLLRTQLQRTGASDKALEDILTLVLAICRRSAYLALLVQNPAALERMVDLFCASDWVAQAVIRHPALLDELIDPALGHRLPDRAELQTTIARMATREDDTERAVDTLNYLKRAQSLRLAVAELEGTLDSGAAEQELTMLAEELLQGTLTLASRMLEARHGALADNALAIIGYGSLGARTISYDSDLDLVFLHAKSTSVSNGSRPLAAEVWFTRLIRRLLAMSTTLTAAGRLYEIDTRLRPNGKSGLLVSPMTAFERYQREKAWVWEWQALTRARPVAGSPALGERFQAIREQVLHADKAGLDLPLEIAKMRQRMRDQLAGDPLKHGPGGLLDIEFLAQLGVLTCAPLQPGLPIPHSPRAQLELLGTLDWLSPEAAAHLSTTHRQLVAARHLSALRRSGPESTPDRTRSAQICAQFGLIPLPS